MASHTPTVAGIDVGGKTKGFHAAILRDGTFETRKSCDPTAITSFLRERGATVVAIDAPCGWSQLEVSPMGRSRLCERELRLLPDGPPIQCFRTPSLEKAREHVAKAGSQEKSFYGWVFNGLEMYDELRRLGHNPYNGTDRSGPVTFETFPNAIASFLKGERVSAQRKVKLANRQAALQELKYDISKFDRDIDFIDAALCAVAAKAFLEGKTTEFGNATEGFIVVPKVGYTTSA